jgi:hypothetical protein
MCLNGLCTQVLPFGSIPAPPEPERQRPAAILPGVPDQ